MTFMAHKLYLNKPDFKIKIRFKVPLTVTLSFFKSTNVYQSPTDLQLVCMGFFRCSSGRNRERPFTPTLWKVWKEVRNRGKAAQLGTSTASREDPG